MAATPLTVLATYMAGEFENQQQAAAEPAWYVHLRLWQRPVPSLCTQSVHTFFLEQANVISGKPPYRQRIVQIRADDASDLLQAPLMAQLKAQYFALKSPLKFQGGGDDANLLKRLSLDDLVTLPNSGAAIEYQPVGNGSDGYRFQAALKDGQLCSFEYGGKQRYVYLGFDIEPQYDKGGAQNLLKTYEK